MEPALTTGPVELTPTQLRKAVRLRERVGKAESNLQDARAAQDTFVRDLMEQNKGYRLALAEALGVNEATIRTIVKGRPSSAGWRQRKKANAAKKAPARRAS